MGLPPILEDGAFLTFLGSVLTAIVTIVVAAVRWVNQRFDHHDERIAELERNHVNQEEFDTAISRLYSKLEEGFKETNKQFQELYRLLLERKP